MGDPTYPLYKIFLENIVMDVDLTKEILSVFHGEQGYNRREKEIVLEEREETEKAGNRQRNKNGKKDKDSNQNKNRNRNRNRNKNKNKIKNSDRDRDTKTVGEQNSKNISVSINGLMTFADSEPVALRWGEVVPLYFLKEWIYPI